jgi:hypothetical protein
MRGSAVALAVLLTCGIAAAHLRFPTVTAERWLELDLASEPMRLGYRLGFGAERAATERRHADTDGDAEVSAAEGNAALDAHTAALLERVRVCIGPSLSQVECKKLERRDVERVEAEGWAPGPDGHLHLIWRLSLGASARDVGAVRIEDDYQVAGVEMTDVQVQAPPHSALLRVGDGAQPEPASSQFTWLEARRPAGPRVVVATWKPPRQSLLGWLVLVAVVVAAALILLRRRAPAPRQYMD